MSVRFALQNPIQVVVDAVINSGPREDSTRIGSGGTVRRQAVDVSPLRRVNMALFLLTTGVSDAFSFSRELLPRCVHVCFCRSQPPTGA